MALNEADTCRVYVTPKLQAAGWASSPHSLNEQKVFTDGRIFAAGGTVTKGDDRLDWPSNGSSPTHC
jgi:type I restriction enzyme, R subunit